MIRAIRSFASVVAVGALSVVPKVARAVPPPNASLEMADPVNAAKPARWESSAWAGANQVLEARFAYLDTGGQDGSRFLRIEVQRRDGEGDAKWQTELYEPDAGGGAYRVSDWYRSNVTSQLFVYATDGAAQEAWLPVAQAPPSASWAQASGTVDLPEWTRQVRLAHVLPKVGFVEVDSFAATRMQGGGARAKARVAITWDDGWKTSKIGIAAMDKRGIVGTHFLVSEYTDSPKYKFEYLESPEIKEIIRAKHEVGSHSLLHEDLSKMQPEYLELNLVKSKAQLEVFGIKCVGIASPFGFYNDYVLERAKVSYLFHRTVKPGINVQPYKLNELYGVVVDNEMKLSDLQAYVEDTRTQDGLLILVLHRVSEDAPLASFVKPSVWESMLDYMQTANTDIRPLGEHLGFWKWEPIPDDPPVVHPLDTSDRDAIPEWERVTGRGPDDEGCRATPTWRRRGLPWLPLALAAAFTAFRLRSRSQPVQCTSRTRLPRASK